MPCADRACLGRCATPYTCSQGNPLFIAQFTNSSAQRGAEHVHLEPEPRPMPVTFAGPEPKPYPWAFMAWVIALSFIAGALLRAFGFIV